MNYDTFCKLSRNILYIYIYIKEREYKIYNIIKYFLIILFSNFNLFIYIVY